MSIYIFAITIVILVLALYDAEPVSELDIWTPSPGKFNKAGTKVNIGPGKWEDARIWWDGKTYWNPLTRKLEPIPGVISDDKTTVFNGKTWEPVTLSTDGKSYLNPVKNKYVPVELVRTDKNGRDWQWNLFGDYWMGY